MNRLVNWTTKMRKNFFKTESNKGQIAKKKKKDKIATTQRIKNVNIYKELLQNSCP